MSNGSILDFLHKAQVRSVVETDLDELGECNEENIYLILNKYKKAIKNYLPNELYKWEAVRHFQENWDINAADFPEMLKESFKKAANLLTSAMYFPYSMIKGMAEREPETVRSMFVNLYNEDIPLRERIDFFIEKSEELLAKYWGVGKNHYQNLHAISVYLTFRFPNKYYIYQSLVDRRTCSFIGFNIKSGEKNDALKNYFSVCDLVNEYVKNDEELHELFNTLAPAEYNDDDDHMLTMDVVYFAGNSYLAEKPDKKVHYWLYSPGENASAWDECVQKNILVLGWDEIGDFEQYPYKFTIEDKIKETSNTDNPMDAALTVYEFWKVLKEGDIVIAKHGLRNILGYGVVKNNTYVHDDTREKYKNVREVEWIKVGNWDVSNTIDKRPLIQKTLTDITEYEGYGEKIIDLIEGRSFTIDDETNEQNNDAQLNDNTSPIGVKKYDSYSEEDFLNEVYISKNKYEEICGLLENKKNIILQGAPGVGKTFMAKRLAYSIMQEKNSDRIEFVQFHQSYAYEDFIEGYRPVDDGFKLEKGIFYNFCKKAQNHPDESYYLIIDEINRGNLSKIFGELLMLIEKDKRESDYVTLAYSKEKFSVPKNLYIIGMMNTADRSLAILDYALRRRFSFVDVNPAFDNEKFKEYQKDLGSEEFDRVIEIIKNLNNDIKNDTSLGEGFTIGHSYFCNLNEADSKYIRSIIKYEIIPMLKEYWFDDENKLNEWKDKLLEG